MQEGVLKNGEVFVESESLLSEECDAIEILSD